MCQCHSVTLFSVLFQTDLYSCFLVSPISLVPESFWFWVAKWLFFPGRPPFPTPVSSVRQRTPSFQHLPLLSALRLFTLSLNYGFALSCHPREQNQRPEGEGTRNLCHWLASRPRQGQGYRIWSRFMLRKVKTLDVQCHQGVL